MSKASDVRWGRWVGAFAGVVLLLKSVAYVFSRLFRLARNEVQARGGDVAFVLDLTQRGKSGGGHGP
jgi:hypothetical protein